MPKFSLSDAPLIFWTIFGQNFKFPTLEGENAEGGGKVVLEVGYHEIAPKHTRKIGNFFEHCSEIFAKLSHLIIADNNLKNFIQLNC